MGAEDYLDTVKGSYGIVGTADCIAVLKRNGLEPHELSFFFELRAHFVQDFLLIHPGLHLHPLFLFHRTFPPNRGRLHARRLDQVIDGLLRLGRGLKSRQLY